MITSSSEVAIRRDSKAYLSVQVIISARPIVVFRRLQQSTHQTYNPRVNFGENPSRPTSDIINMTTNHIGTYGTTSSAVFSTAVVPQEILLHDEYNYEEWKVRVKTYLLSQDLWQDVQQTDEPFPGRGRENFMALHVIQISCGPQPFSEIKNIMNAREAWKTLADRYGRRHVAIEQDTSEENSMSPECRNEEYLCSYEKLYNAVRDGNLDETTRILRMEPLPHDALNRTIPNKGETALHTAVTNGHEHIVEALVMQMSNEGLAMYDSDGYTALTTAAVLGKWRMVKCMLRKYPYLISIRHSEGKNLPVVMAIDFGQIEMARHLYYLTLDKDLILQDNDQEFQDRNGATLFTHAIYTETLDIALGLILTCPRLALALDEYGESPILALASMRHSFPSGNQLGFWKQCIYSCITSLLYFSCFTYTVINILQCMRDVPVLALPTGDIHLMNVSNGEQRQSNQDDQSNRSVLSAMFRYLFSGIQQLLEMKKIHDQSDALLSQMCKVISESRTQQLMDGLVYTAISRAAKNGIFEFVSKMLEMDQRFLWTTDRNQRNIFMLAVLHRQEKIFNILYGLDRKIMNYSLTSKVDVNENNILHMAGMTEDSTWVNKIPGAALQMQRELQWFKEVEGIVHPKAKESTNNDGLTPRQLFTKNHKNLMEKGEKWMKGTATSCTVVGALIATIMFAAAFTVPGGNDQTTGFPIFLKQKLFMLFIICDALSLFSSSTSMLMFLGILTSTYAEEDFLEYLPRQMIIGLFTLFCSIATMMIAFSTALIIMLHDQYSWILIPIISLACVSVTPFILMQYSLLKNMIFSTYGPGIFDRKKKR
ncbi:uncharacterized protein LOC121241466 [Juglans microcarpa x Juglans regia]|uniref:uncharacterized protein LOC121241466 n=1 Tax=Juglans microcarpa x Juglans regia TaxID=2249226 RepID=UPI001B7DACA5|nr:uncharacterized protein LOC121241466 [Juglans microcarpa x Juglans regia]